MSDEEYKGRCSAAKVRWFNMSEEERQITYVPFLGIIGIVNTHDGKNLVVSQ